MTRREDLAYCAGLFDGEGCIIIRKWASKNPLHQRRNTCYVLHAEVTQVRVEPIEALFSVFGGRMFFQRQRDKNSKYSGRWWWCVDSDRASQVLQTLRPFLRLKGTEADIAIQFQRTKLNRADGRSFKLGLTQDEMDGRERAYVELQRLKQRHYDPAVQADYASRPKESRLVTA